MDQEINIINLIYIYSLLFLIVIFLNLLRLILRFTAEAAGRSKFVISYLN